MSWLLWKDDTYLMGLQTYDQCNVFMLSCHMSVVYGDIWQLNIKTFKWPRLTKKAFDHAMDGE